MFQVFSALVIVNLFVPTPFMRIRPTALLGVLLALISPAAATTLYGQAAPTAAGKPVPADVLPRSTEENLARPLITGRHAMVTSLHPLSSMAGMRVLQQGGNAFDAAIATALASTVVDPKDSTIGGQGFAMVYVAKEKRVRAL